MWKHSVAHYSNSTTVENLHRMGGLFRQNPFVFLNKEGITMTLTLSLGQTNVLFYETLEAFDAILPQDMDAILTGTFGVSCSLGVVMTSSIIWIRGLSVKSALVYYY